MAVALEVQQNEGRVSGDATAVVWGGSAVVVGGGSAVARSPVVGWGAQVGGKQLDLDSVPSVSRRC